MEENVVKEEVLTDDDRYAKLQTEKLLKRKKQKQIATSICLGLAFALAVIIIVLATVPVSLKPRFLTSDFEVVRFYSSANPSRAISQGDEDYKEFMTAYNKSFNQSYINAIFNGSLMSYSLEEKKLRASDVVGTSGGELLKNNSYFLEIKYANSKPLLKQNGSKYVSLSSSSAWNGYLEFKTAYVVVNNTDGFQKNDVYVVVKYPNIEYDCVVKITVKANTYEIYKLWKDFTQK